MERNIKNRFIINIKKYKNPVIEVPLLNKAHLEYLFKNIIFVDADESIREERISSTRPYDAKQAIALFKKSNPITKENTIVFYNNFNDLKTLKNEINNNLINKL